MSGLADRRHHEMRVKRNTKEKGKLWGMELTKKEIGRSAAVHYAGCSCAMCGNPRTHFAEETIQEVKNEVKYNEELVEINTPEMTPDQEDALNQQIDMEYYDVDGYCHPEDIAYANCRQYDTLVDAYDWDDAYEVECPVCGAKEGACCSMEDPNDKGLGWELSVSIHTGRRMFEETFNKDK